MKIGSYKNGVVSLLLLAISWSLPLARAQSAEAPVKFKGREVVPDRFLAKWKPEAKPDPARPTAARVGSASAAAFKQVPSLQEMRAFPKLPGLVALKISKAKAAASARAAKPGADAVQARIDELMASGLFEYVEPDYIVRASAVPTDAAFTDGRLWGLRNTGQSGGVAGADIGAVAAWDVTTGENTVIVGVIDTGIRYTHQDLAANMWRNPGEIAGNGIDDDANGYVDDVFGINAATGSGNPMDDNDHGTHCAGTIGATANGGGPHVGVAWNVRLMALKFLTANGSGATSDAIECIDYAISKGARILSNSWGGGGASNALRDAIVRANQAGVLFVAAAGNEATDNDRTSNFPSNYDVPNVVAVAALDRADRLANFSNFGAQTVDLGAPGVDIFSCSSTSDTSYVSFNGTSMATPHVAGVAALLRARFPTISVAELRDRLLRTTVPVAALAGRTVTGGRVNARAALDATTDGVLELAASVARSPLPAGQATTVFVRVSDLAPLTGATVTARFGAGTATTLRDNGVAPDPTAGDGSYSGTLTAPATGSTATLTVNASAPGKQSAERAFVFPVAGVPVNDAFAAATATVAGAVRSIGSNENASRETGEPRSPAVAGDQTVWWTWRAGASPSVTITTSGSTFDTTLAVYRGTALGGLTLVAANDDSNGTQSAVTFAAVAGTLYHVQVAGYAGATGAIALNYPSPGAGSSVPVITSEPANAEVLAGTPLRLAVVASNATSYQWFFENQAIPGATNPEYVKNAAALSDQGRYRVRVSNAAGFTDSREASVTVAQVQVRPENDAFANAGVLGGSSGRVDGTNRTASGETGEPNHAGFSLPLASIWYRWTAPSAGTVAFDTLGSNFDTTLAAYEGATLASLAAVATNDDRDPETRQSVIEFPCDAGVTYRIAIAGYEGDEGETVLNYEFISAAPILVPNDAFAARRLLVGSEDTASNVDATGETGEANHAASSQPLNSVWWSWTAPADGQATFDTGGSDFDTTLAVYAGATLASLEVLAENDDFTDVTSRVVLPVTAGATYAIAVDGYGNNQGTARLAVVLEADPTTPTPPSEVEPVPEDLSEALLGTPKNLRAAMVPGKRRTFILRGRIGAVPPGSQVLVRVGRRPARRVAIRGDGTFAVTIKGGEGRNVVTLQTVAPDGRRSPKIVRVFRE